MSKEQKVEFFDRKFSIQNLDLTQANLIENHIKKMKSVTYINNLMKHP
jgi:hypothetical protein